MAFHSLSRSCALEAVDWALSGPLRSRGSLHGHRRPWWAGTDPVFLYQEVCLVNFLALHHYIYEARTRLFNEAHQAVRGFPHDKMLNEKLRATSKLCYHSICLRPQTGHYPAIIFLDLQSLAEEPIAAVCSPLGGTDGNQLENLHLHDPAEQLIRSGYLFST